nr:MAG TPA: hypothetical protein [Caudoviricetes sp.]
MVSLKCYLRLLLDNHRVLFLIQLILKTKFYT